MNKPRPAFYALREGSWRDYITLLHPPYTVWHLSYVVLGAAAAPHVYLDRTAGVVLAFFLAVGLGAHALDEFHHRPLGTHISNFSLLGITSVSLAGALAIGVIATLTINLLTMPFLIFGIFSVIVYNLELWNGRFHSDLYFGLAWGAFPALTGYWANSGNLTTQALLISLACLLLSLAQRTLSKQVRELRRKTKSIQGSVEFTDGRIENIDTPYLLSVPEKALRFLSISVVLLASGWLAARLW
jgi:heme O synthase-like polyprenyltransferase